MNTTIEIEEGSTSLGSCRLVDIVNGIRFLYDADDKLNELVSTFDIIETEQIDYIFDEICDRLNEIAPEDMEFGAHPTDGADFGFWNIEPDTYPGFPEENEV